MRMIEKRRTVAPQVLTHPPPRAHPNLMYKTLLSSRWRSCSMLPSSTRASPPPSQTPAWSPASWQQRRATIRRSWGPWPSRSPIWSRRTSMCAAREGSELQGRPCEALASGGSSDGPQEPAVVVASETRIGAPSQPRLLTQLPRPATSSAVCALPCQTTKPQPRACARTCVYTCVRLGFACVRGDVCSRGVCARRLQVQLL